jgi:hypothetical protein
MTKLDEMWAAFAEYQKFADADGHGKTWVGMCELKTADAAYIAAADAPWCAPYADNAAIAAAAIAAAAAAWATATDAEADRNCAAAYAAHVAAVESWAQEAIRYIDKAISNKENSND